MSKRMCEQVPVLPSRRLVRPAADDGFEIVTFVLRFALLPYYRHNVLARLIKHYD